MSESRQAHLGERTARNRADRGRGVDAVVALPRRGSTTVPSSEHVTVFEQAHESLRRALADAGEDAVRPRLRPCLLGGCGSTPSWSAAAWPGRASTPAS